MEPYILGKLYKIVDIDNHLHSPIHLYRNTAVDDITDTDMNFFKLTGFQFNGKKPGPTCNE